jgi:hypothetical protein
VLVGSVGSCGRYFLVKSTNSYVWDARNYGLRWPDLFPYNRGTLEEPRKIRISEERYIEHLLRLSSGSFQSPEFILSTYNKIARQSASSGMFLIAKTRRIHRFPQLDGNLKELKMVLEEDKKWKKRNVNFVPRGNLNSVALDFAKSVRVCCSKMKHSGAAAKESRLELYSMV